ncbi:wax ester/triacylglycerol synthase family O-acyltransferase [Nocardia farcinica]|uniref:wax ester/triacylglycerol synthase family O-acyltransferase n=1 Tax=Nocardia farcinica TaxID=37329 RepID=UPI002453B0F8|nr:wax ester/triacylglycerol synthase family O-acyltransferase [Nocardia farcinica]
MSRLGPLDAGFLELEDTDQHVSAGIGVVAILGGKPGERDAFGRELGRRVAVDDRLRQKVRRGPLDISAPVWVPDTDFDLGHHLTWAALPQPRDEQALWQLVATTMERRLDRDHPLWHCTVVEELDGDRWAMILCAHHSMVDGVSGVSLFERLCDPPPGVSGRAPDPPQAETPQAQRRGLLHRATTVPAQAVRAAVAAPRVLARTALGMAPLVWNIVDPRRGSSLNGPIGRQRRYAVARVRLDDIHRVRAEFGGTVNDIALVAVTAALRAMLLARGERPRPDTIRVLTPVSTRSANARGRLDNRVSVMLPLLPVDLADPVDQLRAVRTQLGRLKHGSETGAGQTLIALAGLVPFGPMAWTVRAALRYPQHGIAALATNVPGPTETLRLFGSDVHDLAPFAPIAMRLRLGIAMLSYRDTLCFGITGDYDSTPDTDSIARTIPAAVTTLLDRAGR